MLSTLESNALKYLASLLSLYCLTGWTLLAQTGPMHSPPGFETIEDKTIKAKGRTHRTFTFENKGLLLVAKTGPPVQGFEIQFFALSDKFESPASKKWFIPIDFAENFGNALPADFKRLIVTNAGLLKDQLWLEFNQDLIVRLNEEGALTGAFRIAPIAKQGTDFEYGRNYYQKRWLIAPDGRLWYSVSLEHANWRMEGGIDSLPWLEMTPETYAATTLVAAYIDLPEGAGAQDSIIELTGTAVGPVSEFYRRRKFARHALKANIATFGASGNIFMNQAAEPSIVVMQPDGSCLKTFGDPGRHFGKNDTVCLLSPDLFPKLEEFIVRSRNPKLTAHNLFCREASAYYGKLQYLPRRKWVLRYYAKGVADSSVFDNLNRYMCRIPARRPAYLQIYDAADDYKLIYDEPVPAPFHIIGTDEKGFLWAVTDWDDDGVVVSKYQVER